METATEVAERLRSSIEATEILYGHIQTRITASFGLGQLQSSSNTWEHLFMSCDKALYEVKRAGGNLSEPRSSKTSKLTLLGH